MIEYKNGKYKKCDYKVILKNRGNEETHYTNDKEYWQDMVAKHEHLTDLTFTEFSLTVEQEDRLAEVNENNIGRGHQAEVRNYIETGELPEGFSHGLRDLKLKKDENRIRELEKASGVGRGGERGIAGRIDELEDRITSLEEKIK